MSLVTIWGYEVKDMDTLPEMLETIRRRKDRWQHHGSGGSDPQLLRLAYISVAAVRAQHDIF